MSYLSDLALQGFLVDIMKNLRLRSCAKSVVIYLLTQDRARMKLFLSEGVRLQSFLPMSHGVGVLAFKTKEVIVATEATSDPRFIKDPFDDSGVTVHTIVIVPIMDHKGEVYGVVEMANKIEPFSGDEINAMKSFGALIALALENRDLESISDHGNVEFEMDRWIDPIERVGFAVPEKLSLLTTEKMELEKMKFEAANWNKIELFKIVFSIFAASHLLQEFSITAETFFSFIYAVRETYLDIPHHNWIHAVDVLHVVHLLAISCKLESHISKLDLLCLYIAALCQDAGHPGYSPSVIAQNELSSQVLNQGQSGECARHCAAVVNILAVKENNILKNVPADKVRGAWDLILRLIMGTDMSNHFEIIKNAKETPSLNWKEYPKMVLALTLVLKIAVIGFMYKDMETCMTHIGEVRTELELDKPVDPEEDLFGGPAKMPPEIRRKKEILAFGQLIAGQLIRVSVPLMEALRPLANQCAEHMKAWTDELYPPEEESTSIVIA